jgi:hypothetical protein
MTPNSYLADWAGGPAISPPNGISNIWLSEDGETIIVIRTHNKQIAYDLDGNQAQQ